MSLLIDTFGKAKQAANLGLAAAAFAMPFNALAGSSSTNGNTSTNIIQTYKRTNLSLATEYSMDSRNPRIGIAVSRPPNSPHTSEQLEAFFTRNFEAQNIPVKVFLEDKAGYKNTVITFCMEGIMSDAYHLGNITEGFKDIVSLYRARLAEKTGSLELTKN